MTSVLLEMPDEPAARHQWLDFQLVGPDLDLLVAELEAVHGRSDAVPVLDEVLGKEADAVLAGGLGRLPRPGRTLLLRNPTLLLELRRRVIIDGGPYWGDLLRDEIERDLAPETAADRATAAALAEVVKGQFARAEPAPARTTTGRPSGSGRWAGSVAALAACLLVGTAAGWFLRSPGPAGTTPAGGWGLAKLSQLPRGAGDAAVLTALADQLGEWGNKRPDTPAALAQRLGELRTGCSALQLSDDLPLSPDNRQWVRASCRGWADQFARQVRDVESGQPVADVRAAADATVASAVKSLRDRAATAARG